MLRDGAVTIDASKCHGTRWTRVQGVREERRHRSRIQWNYGTIYYHYGETSGECLPRLRDRSDQQCLLHFIHFVHPLALHSLRITCLVHMMNFVALAEAIILHRTRARSAIDNAAHARRGPCQPPLAS